MYLDGGTYFLAISSCASHFASVELSLFVHELIGGNDSFLKLLKKLSTKQQHFLPASRGGKLLKWGFSHSEDGDKIFYINDPVFSGFVWKSNQRFLPSSSLSAVGTLGGNEVH